MPTITPISSLTLSPDRLWQLSVHPRKPFLAVASSDKSAHVVTLQTFRSLSTVEGGHKRSIRAVAWKPDEDACLATGSFDATAGIWRGDVSRFTGMEVDDRLNIEEDSEEEEDWRFSVVLDGHDSEIKGVAWNAGANLLATCSRDKSVWIWEDMGDDNFETIAVLQEHTQDVKCVKWHPEEELLASSSYDDTIRLYREDIDDWTCCAVLQGHDSTVWKVDFEARKGRAGERLVSCSDDLTVRIWKRMKTTAVEKAATPSILRGNEVEEDWELESILPRAHERPVYSVSWSPVTGRIVTCGGDGKIVVYEEKESTQESGEAKKQWSIFAELQNAHGVYEVNDVAWSKRWDKNKKYEEEEIIVSAGDDGVVNFYTIE